MRKTTFAIQNNLNNQLIQNMMKQGTAPLVTTLTKGSNLLASTTKATDTDSGMQSKNQSFTGGISAWQ